MSNQTGPTTPAGKLASCGNATLHNGCSERLIVEGERLEDFHALLASLVDHYQPADAHEQSLVEDLAHGRWFLWRRQRGSASVDADVYEIQPDPARWSFVEHKRVALADRYRTAAERSFNRALKNVEAFAKDRVKTYRWEATYDLAVRRLELAKRKHQIAVEKAAMKAKKLPPPTEPPFRSVKSAVSSPIASAAQPFSPLDITQKNPEKGACTA
jgi:hypothetical protein